MCYIAVIGDLVASKKIESRAKFQEKLHRSLDTLSQKNAALASPYTLTLGDEFQAVYQSSHGLFADLCRLRVACLPARVRLSLGVGEINTAINPRQSLGMDGPAFHAARAGIESLKKNDGAFAISGSIWGNTAPLGALIDLISSSTSTWKKSRWIILADLLAGHSVSEISREAKLTEAAVYKNIRHARLESFVTVLAYLEAALLPSH